jgi:hypothetical protein
MKLILEALALTLLAYLPLAVLILGIAGLLDGHVPALYLGPNKFSGGDQGECGSCRVGPGNFHPEPPTDPDLTLSRHPARATARRLPPSIEHRAPPVAG